MWTTELRTIAIFALVLCSTVVVQETAAFTTSCNTIQTATNSRLNTSQLSESFYNFGKDAPDGEYNDNNESAEQPKQKKGFFGNFFQELDNFVDDATSRRLGAGAAFYGKRKSSFYGENDSNRKKSQGFDSTEDYRGPNNAGYFKWMQNPETGEMEPVTRLKEKNIERKIKF